MVRKHLLVAIALINCQNPIHAAEWSNGQVDSLRHQPESGYVREIVIGGLSGVIFGIVGAGLGAKVQDCDGDDSGEFCGLGGAAVGGIIGLSLGSAAGVYAAGAQTDKQGTFLGALAGSILGSVSGLMALSGTGVDGWPFLLIAPPVFAAIGYNLTRPHTPSHSYYSGAALLNLDGGRIRLGMPFISARLDPLGNKTFTRSMELMKVDL